MTSTVLMLHSLPVGVTPTDLRRSVEKVLNRKLHWKEPPKILNTSGLFVLPSTNDQMECIHSKLKICGSIIKPYIPDENEIAVFLNNFALNTCSTSSSSKRKSRKNGNSSRAEHKRRSNGVDDHYSAENTNARLSPPESPPSVPHLSRRRKRKKKRNMKNKVRNAESVDDDMKYNEYQPSMRSENMSYSESTVSQYSQEPMPAYMYGDGMASTCPPSVLPTVNEMGNGSMNAIAIPAMQNVIPHLTEKSAIVWYQYGIAVKNDNAIIWVTYKYSMCLEIERRRLEYELQCSINVDNAERTHGQLCLDNNRIFVNLVKMRVSYDMHDTYDLRRVTQLHGVIGSNVGEIVFGESNYATVVDAKDIYLYDIITGYHGIGIQENMKCGTNVSFSLALNTFGNSVIHRNGEPCEFIAFNVRLLNTNHNNEQKIILPGVTHGAISNAPLTPMDGMERNTHMEQLALMDPMFCEDFGHERFNGLLLHRWMRSSIGVILCYPYRNTMDPLTVVFHDRFFTRKSDAKYLKSGQTLDFRIAVNPQNMGIGVYGFVAVDIKLCNDQQFMYPMSNGGHQSIDNNKRKYVGNVMVQPQSTTKHGWLYDEQNEVMSVILIENNDQIGKYEKGKCFRFNVRMDDEYYIAIDLIAVETVTHDYMDILLTADNFVKCDASHFTQGGRLKTNGNSKYKFVCIEPVNQSTVDIFAIVERTETFVKEFVNGNRSVLMFGVRNNGKIIGQSFMFDTKCDYIRKTIALRLSFFDVKIDDDFFKVNFKPVIDSNGVTLPDTYVIIVQGSDGPINEQYAQIARNNNSNNYGNEMKYDSVSNAHASSIVLPYITNSLAGGRNSVYSQMANVTNYSIQQLMNLDDTPANFVLLRQIMHNKIRKLTGTPGIFTNPLYINILQCYDNAKTAVTLKPALFELSSIEQKMEKERTQNIMNSASAANSAAFPVQLPSIPRMPAIYQQVPFGNGGANASAMQSIGNSLNAMNINPSDVQHNNNNVNDNSFIPPYPVQQQQQNNNGIISDVRLLQSQQSSGVMFAQPAPIPVAEPETDRFGLPILSDKSKYKAVAKEYCQQMGWNKPVEVTQQLQSGYRATVSFGRRGREKSAVGDGFRQKDALYEAYMNLIPKVLPKLPAIKLMQKWLPGYQKNDCVEVAAINSATGGQVRKHPKSLLLEWCSKSNLPFPKTSWSEQTNILQDCRKWIASVTFCGKTVQWAAQKKKVAEHRCFQQLADWVLSGGVREISSVHMRDNSYFQ